MADGSAKAGKGRITIRTVAADAGVSVAAVSKVLRNAYGVSDALRLKVETSIGKLGYRPSVAARGMRGQTYTIGVSAGRNPESVPAIGDRRDQYRAGAVELQGAAGRGPVQGQH